MEIEVSNQILTRTLDPGLHEKAFYNFLSIAEHFTYKDQNLLL